MSKTNPPKRKVVVTTTPKKEKEVATPAKGKSFRTSSDKPTTQQLIFSKQNYYWMLLGVGLIILGMILMSGGHMPSPDVWDDSIIYSPRRTILAPIVILAGLGVEIYAIFKRY
ncbi:MAG: DUF3098 domain-containing protein [Lewinellaceae bacterium]|nr:DUF3098 domain-containing protein [Lewinellaceae bacterium]